MNGLESLVYILAQKTRFRTEVKMIILPYDCTAYVLQNVSAWQSGVIGKFQDCFRVLFMSHCIPRYLRYIGG